MRTEALLSAALMLSGVAEAAPKGLDLGKLGENLVGKFKSNIKDSPLATKLDDARHRLPRNVDNQPQPTATATPVVEVVRDDGMEHHVFTLDCPLPPVVVSTTTVDVTVYVTPTEEPCDEADMTNGASTTTQAMHTSPPSETEPCDDDTMLSSSSSSAPVQGTVTPSVAFETEPCEEDDMTSATETTATPQETEGPPGGLFVTRTEPINEDETKTTLSSPVSGRVTSKPGDHEAVSSVTIVSGNWTLTKPLSPPTSPVVIVGSSSTVTLSVARNSTSSSVPAQSVASEPCDDEMSSTAVTASAPVTSGSSSNAFTASTLRMSPSVPFGNSTQTTGVPGNPTAKVPEGMSSSSASTEPCDTDSMSTYLSTIGDTFSSSVETPSYTTSRTFSVTPFVTPTTASSSAPTGNPSTTCLIDTAMPPARTGTATVTPTVTITPVVTVCVHDEHRGRPNKDHAYCGVNAEKPADTFFIAEFVEERPGVPVSEEGCFQFCDSDMDTAENCHSYSFSHGSDGVPRCALYGMPVSYVVTEIDITLPATWFDLRCGSPSEGQWLDAMPASHREGHAHHNGEQHSTTATGAKSSSSGGSSSSTKTTTHRQEETKSLSASAQSMTAAAEEKQGEGVPPLLDINVGGLL